MTKQLVIGIAPLQYIRQRTIDIAAGRVTPEPDDPKVWFTSLESLGRLLNDKNTAMLETIRDYHPSTVSELAQLTHRAQSNVSRTLAKMAYFQLVQLLDNGVSKTPVVDWDEIMIKTPHALTAYNSNSASQIG